ncbi:MAG TPA: molybdopterin-dependent oxidoreductase [Planctomycetaceae bacterium]
MSTTNGAPKLTVRVNGREVGIAEHERLNAIQAAQRAGVEVPHYCWHPALSVVASCRMCLVEVGQTQPDGSVAMQPKLVPACQTPVKDGTVLVTDSPKVKAAQNQVLEFLLLNHPLDCPVCDQAGECKLQDYAYRYGRGYSRLREPKLQKPDKDHIGEHVTLFTDRCVMCSRCVRFTREVSGTGELQVINRGSHAEIDVFPGRPCNNKLAGNVVDICPVGALCSKDFLYKQRVWWLESKESVCPNCSTGCSVHVDQNEDRVYRLRPRFNPKAQGHFMCDEGRFGFGYVHARERLSQPVMKTGGGERAAAGWDAVLPALRTSLQAAARRPGALAAVLSPWMTVEEAYLLAKYLKGLSPSARLALGPARVVGEDDQYPKDVHGRAVDPPKFIIRAEKCPNRRGVEAVLRHFEGEVASYERVFEAAEAGEVDAVYLAGGDPEPWMTVGQAAVLKRLRLLVVQDILPSPASVEAHYLLPGGAFPEKDGTFVNHAGLAQAIRRAIHPPGDARPDGRILWDLAGRRGLFHAANLRREIAAEIPELRALSAGDLGPHGVLLDAEPDPEEEPVAAHGVREIRTN